MARIRTVKPEFFKHHALFSLEKEHQLPIRLAFQGLWCCADRDGRFKWLPMQLKLDVLPYDEVDFEKILDILNSAGFITKYKHEDKEYAYIPTFTEHQRITGSEALAASKLPPPKKIGKNKASGRKQSGNTSETLKQPQGRQERKGKDIRKGKEGNGVTGIFPDQSFEIFLSDMEVGKAIQYIEITKHTKADSSYVQSIWDTFKIKNFTGQKFYKNEREIIGHFFESLKFIQVNGTATHQQLSSGSGKLGTSQARIDAAKKF